MSTSTPLENEASATDAPPSKLLPISLQSQAAVVPVVFDRLSTPPEQRIIVGIVFSSLLGATLGMSHGAKETGLRFRAENSHRFPTSSKGWYLYHKSKNYATALGGISEARRMGLKLGFWTGMFLIVEDMFDSVRGARSANRALDRIDALREMGFSEHDIEAQVVGGQDLGSTMGAGLVTSGAFSLWTRVPATAAVRMVRMGLFTGFVYGGLQDALRLLKGRPVGYVEWAKRVLGVGNKETDLV